MLYTRCNGKCNTIIDNIDRLGIITNLLKFENMIILYYRSDVRIKRGERA